MCEVETGHRVYVEMRMVWVYVGRRVVVSSHEVNSHETNSHVVNPHKINFPPDQLPLDQLPIRSTRDKC